MIAQLFISESQLLELAESLIKNDSHKGTEIWHHATELKAFQIEQRHKQIIQRELKPESFVCGVEKPKPIECTQDYCDREGNLLDTPLAYDSNEYVQYEEAQQSLIFKAFEKGEAKNHFKFGDKLIIDIGKKDCLIVMYGIDFAATTVLDLLYCIHKHNEPLEKVKEPSNKVKPSTMIKGANVFTHEYVEYQKTQDKLIQPHWSDSVEKFILNG